MATMILIFVIFYVTASLWDIVHVNKLLDKAINPGAHKHSPTLPPAPRLIIPGQQLPAARSPESEEETHE